MPAVAHQLNVERRGSRDVQKWLGADEGVVKGVDDEPRQCDAPEPVLDAAASIVIVGRSKSAACGSVPVVEVVE